MNPISEERRVFVQQKLDEWCANGGYKDSNVNMLTLSRTLCISKNELSLFFDQCLHSNFRIWLSEIRLNAAKKMMLEFQIIATTSFQPSVDSLVALIFTESSRQKKAVLLQNGETSNLQM